MIWSFSLTALSLYISLLSLGEKGQRLAITGKLQRDSENPISLSKTSGNKIVLHPQPWLLSWAPDANIQLLPERPHCLVLTGTSPWPSSALGYRSPPRTPEDLPAWHHVIPLAQASGRGCMWSHSLLITWSSLCPNPHHRGWTND